MKVTKQSLFQLQKSLSNSENERRVLTERLDSVQQNLSELRRAHQHIQDQHGRLQTELANNEVQRAGLESQLRLSNWPGESSGNEGRDGEMQRVQRERSELKSKVETLQDKVNQQHIQKEASIIALCLSTHFFKISNQNYMLTRFCIICTA